MKKIKMFVAILAAVTVLMLLSDVGAATAEAAEPISYSVTYSEENDEWLYWKTDDDDTAVSSLYYLLQKLKDGDTVVVYNNSTNTESPLNLGSVNLGNLTYVNTTWAIVYAGSVQDCFVLGNTRGTINCNVENAYVYDPVTFNFNNNVTNLYLYADDEIHSNVNVVGTVGHLLAVTPPNREYHEHFNLYDFPANTLCFSEGVFKPANANFNTPEQHAALVASRPSNSAGTTSNDEYDKVPKTGQSNWYLLFLCASVICFAGSQAVRRAGK